MKEKAAKGTNPATAILNVKAGTYTVIPNRNGGAPELHNAKTPINVLGVTGNIEVWLAATAKRPATAKQIITR